MRVLATESRGPLEIPAEFSVAHLKVDRQWHQKSIGHGVDEGRAFFDGETLLAHARIEGLQRQSLEPVGKTEHCRRWPRKDVLEPRRAPKLQRHLAGLVHWSISPNACSRRAQHESCLALIA